ncbi:MAG: glycosyltransferase family 4 protein [Eubacteriales bacterium]|nr:glycosyltransferase family 4 protein [Eubacteriales bacterium]
MKAVFISNYINHHQIPFSDALYRRLGADYHFIQTEPMEEERLKMGWGLDASKIPYVVFADQEEARCRQLIADADLVLAGWTKRTDLFLPRLAEGKLTLRISERIYREGQWKAVSPRGLWAKYQEHGKFRKQPVYLLCAGAYVASDFSLIGAYPDKMLKFGYFPELRVYEGDQLWEKKRRMAAAAGGGAGAESMQIVWAGRMIPLKHPEFVVRLAKELKREGRAFHIHMVGSGPMEETLRQEIEAEALTEAFTFYGFLTPDKVRDVMEGCRIHLFTSNYLEGWGSVINEGMNSGCCVVANAQAGAAPFLIEDGVNGMTYADGRYENFAAKVKRIFEEPESAERMGKAAYETIAGKWNAEHAAQECLRFYEGWKAGKLSLPEEGPFSKAPKLSARWKYGEGRLE